MLFKITQLSLLFPSFITLALHSLARWSLERDVETGSSLRVGGLLFKTCITATIYDNAPLFPCPDPCLGVSYCSWIAQLAVLRWNCRDAFVSCVNLNPLAQQSQFNPKRQNARLSLCCFRIIMSLINILIKTSLSLIASLFYFLKNLFM